MICIPRVIFLWPKTYRWHSLRYNVLIIIVIIVIGIVCILSIIRVCSWAGRRRSLWGMCGKE